MLTSTHETVMHSYPGLVALVTAKHEETQNIMAAGWHSYISYKPAIYGVAVAKERFTHQLMKKSGHFAINFVSAEYACYIEVAGKRSGRDGDKFTLMQANWREGDATGAPILENAYAAYECETIDRNTYGDHDWFVGKIKLFYQNKEKFGDDRLPNFAAVQLPLYLGKSKYLIADQSTTVKTIDINK